MEQRRMGRTGAPVSALTLGSRAVSTVAERDVDDAVRLVHEALGRGVTAVDVSDAEGAGLAETVLGAALGDRRDDVFLAVRFGDPVDRDPSHHGNGRRWMFRAVERSLERLGTDVIDLYQPAHPDPATSLDETLDALADLVTQGKIRAFGIPGFPAEELVEAQWLRSGGKSASATHAPYSILTRTAERTTFPVARRFGLGVLAAAPLAGGWLAGAYRNGTVQPRSPRVVEQPHAYDIGAPANRRKLDVADRLGHLADESGLTLLELAVGFALTHPDVSSVVIGPRTVSHVDAYAQAAEVVLDDEVLDAIDQVVPPGTHVLERDTGVELPGLSRERLRGRVLTH
ncbi:MULTISPECIES: aldo/keto reductase [unclassified Curtobacterium]|jgi:aryl-alcohol dehydrogenase-like predicted oxidoreductase|uniref:aldo/keto reductase n=1 Tax=unclassified Curtobacterium TaxID=257496 RepID=UPI002862F654|nr:MULTISPECIES: aldo/keto reductase [unclassified Curtobacterium]MDR6169974.1 aryl-alcohol dehydrogenase-like predicted oxidoreductase [Curtobacterium sp. SORGH_AS_0776]MDR6573164.1 aryl-alcohol dehydrogenase-like predicted oxidoreductase [Curtobacterium sp. 320]